MRRRRDISRGCIFFFSFSFFLAGGLCAYFVGGMVMVMVMMMRSSCAVGE